MWRKIFTNSTILEEWKNILHTFEILLVTIFTNAKVEQIFLWIITQTIQLMLGTAKKCDMLEVRHHINIQQRGQEQTQEQ